MSNSIIYIVLMENGTPLPDVSPTFTPSLSFVSVDGKGDPPQLTVPGGASWFMGVQQGTVITVSVPGFSSTVVDTFAPGLPFIGTDPETPIQARLLPLGTWVWTSPALLATNTSPSPGVEATASWNADYVVGGTLQNFDQNSFAAELALTQTGPWTATPGGPSLTVATQSASVTAGASVPVAFGPFIQNWQWFVPGIGIPTGPEAQFVSYSLSITITDSTGNQLNITPSNLIVLIAVDQWKLIDDFIGTTAFIVSSMLAVAAVIASFIPIYGAFVAAGLAIAAAAAQALAQGEIAAAGDPPDPSLAFDRVERFQTAEFGGTEGPQTKNIRTLLARGLRVMEARRVLSVTEGRLDGARRAGKQDDINRQMGHQRRIAAIAREESASLPDLGANADREFAEVLERLRQALTKHPENVVAPSDPDIQPQSGIATRALAALGALRKHPNVAAEVYGEALDGIRKESAGAFAKLAGGIAEAIGQVVSYDQGPPENSASSVLTKR